MNGQGKDHNVCVFVSRGRWFVSYKYYLIFILNLFCEKEKEIILKGRLSIWLLLGSLMEKIMILNCLFIEYIILDTNS